AGSRSHHQAFQRSKTHRRVNAVPVADRCQRAAIAEVACYQAQSGQLFSEQLRCTLSAVLMVDTVKPEAADSLLRPCKWSRINCRGIWYFAVKAGIKDCDLRHRSECLFDQPDSFKLYAIVEWSESRHFFDRGFDGGVNTHGLRILRASVDDTMPDSGN